MHTTINAVIKEFKTTEKNLVELISTFNEKTFNQKPGRDVWSAGQVSEHLLKSAHKVLRILEKSGVSTTRNPEEYGLQLKNTMLDLEHKRKSAENLWPAEVVNQKETLDDLRQTLDATANVAEKVDLTVIPEGVEFPSIGALTKLEWLVFTNYHIRRHMRQIENIREYFD